MLFRFGFFIWFCFVYIVKCVCVCVCKGWLFPELDCLRVQVCVSVCVGVGLCESRYVVCCLKWPLLQRCPRRSRRWLCCNSFFSTTFPSPRFVSFFFANVFAFFCTIQFDIYNVFYVFALLLRRLLLLLLLRPSKTILIEFLTKIQIHLFSFYSHPLSSRRAI